MTTTEPRVFTPPIDVLRNMTERATAARDTRTCTHDNCDQPWTQSASGRPGLWCDTHYPWPQHRNPTPDPARTLDGLRTAAGIPLETYAPISAHDLARLHSRRRPEQKDDAA